MLGVTFDGYWQAPHLTAAAFEGWGRSGSFLQGQLLELANAVVLGAPVLVFGFLTTLVLCVIRGAARRG